MQDSTIGLRWMKCFHTLALGIFISFNISGIAIRRQGSRTYCADGESSTFWRGMEL